MAKSYFLEKELQPQENNIKDILQDKKEFWDKYLTFVKTYDPTISCEWKFYGRAWGWSLVLLKKKKNLLYLTPVVNGFYVSFALGKKGANLAKKEGFTDKIVEIIESGENNNAGRTFDILIQEQDDVVIVEKLMEIKYSLV